jgi:hypothetical protein
MIRRQFKTMSFALLVFLSLIQQAGSQTTRPLLGRFQHSREIVPGGSGPNRLFIDPTLLAGGNSEWIFYYGNERLDTGRKQMIAQAERPSNETFTGVGAAIDLEGFRFARRIAPGKAALNTLPLDAAVLAHSSLEDLRIAASDGHQIPYLLEKGDEPLSLLLPALEKIPDPRSSPEKDRTAGTRTCYRLHLPYANLPAARLTFTTSARVFQRTLRILIEKNPYNERQEPWTNSIAAAIWNHADPENPAPALTLNIPSLKTSEVLVAIEEGDNNPLPVTSTQLLLPAYRMRFFRGDRKDLKLYYGQNDLQAPRYDLAILAPRLMGADAKEISMDPESAEALPNAELLPLKLFWGILIAAVLVLLALVGRLIKKTKEDSPSA